MPCCQYQGKLARNLSVENASKEYKILLKNSNHSQSHSGRQIDATRRHCGMWIAKWVRNWHHGIWHTVIDQTAKQKNFRAYQDINDSGAMIVMQLEFNLL